MGERITFHSVWLGGFKPWQGRGPGTKRGPAWGPYFVTQRDLATGETLRHIEPDNPGHHHRCYRNKATDRYILAGRRGTEFIDLESGDVRWHSWARGVCKYGVMPCNGLLYTPPHACACYVAAKLTGFNAMADREGFVAVYPEGFRRSWADGRGFTRADEKGVDDVGFVVELIGRIRERYLTLPSKTFVIKSGLCL